MKTKADKNRRKRKQRYRIIFLFIFLGISTIFYFLVQELKSEEFSENNNIKIKKTNLSKETKVNNIIKDIEERKIPVIFITAKSDVKDRVKGLKLGAEDYIVKPFSIEELSARVEVVLRRENRLQSKITEGDLEVDIDAHTVRKNGKPVELTVKEFDILVLFLKNKDIALYRETIYERVWQCPFMGETRTVDSHVQRLRHKLHMEEQIVAVYKVGYKYCSRGK